MTADREPSRPIDVYKEIIDQLVRETTHCITARLVERGCFLETSEDAQLNPFLEALSEEQRNTLAGMLRRERIGAIHDVLALLTWWISARGVGITFKGESMPLGLSGEGLHGDFIGRLDDWEWPQEEASPGS